MKIIALFAIQLLLTLSTVDASAFWLAKPKLHNYKHHGLTYQYLGGTKGLILCFHGRGGSAAGWSRGENFKYLNTLRRNGYSFICPTSKNRKSKVWDNRNNHTNRDIRNVESLLKALKVHPFMPIYLVGHSNGGSMVSRFAAFSRKHGDFVVAAHLSSSPGITAIQQSRFYDIPTLFTYGQCDQVVNFRTVEQNAEMLKKDRVFVWSKKLDRRYRDKRSRTCHEFLNTSRRAISFFSIALFK